MSEQYRQNLLRKEVTIASSDSQVENGIPNLFCVKSIVRTDLSRSRISSGNVCSKSKHKFHHIHKKQMQKSPLELLYFSTNNV